MPDWDTIAIPAWATTDDAKAWFLGFVLGCFLRIFRAGLRWFKRVGNDHGGSSND